MKKFFKELPYLLRFTIFAPWVLLAGVVLPKNSVNSRVIICYLLYFAGCFKDASYATLEKYGIDDIYGGKIVFNYKKLSKIKIKRTNGEEFKQ